MFVSDVWNKDIIYWVHSITVISFWVKSELASYHAKSLNIWYVHTKIISFSVENYCRYDWIRSLEVRHPCWHQRFWKCIKDLFTPSIGAHAAVDARIHAAMLGSDTRPRAGSAYVCRWYAWICTMQFQSSMISTFKKPSIFQKENFSIKTIQVNQQYKNSILVSWERFLCLLL